jgi:hypothetical protein
MYYQHQMSGLDQLSVQEDHQCDEEVSVTDTAVNVYTELLGRSKWLKSDSSNDSNTDDTDDTDIVSRQSIHFQSDAGCRIWKDVEYGPFFRTISIRHRRQMGPTCVSNVLAMLSNQLPEIFQKPQCELNTQCPVSWSDELKKHGMKLAYCATDCRRLKHYLPELVQLSDLFVLSFYTGGSNKKPQHITREPNQTGLVIGSHIVALHKDKVYDSARHDGNGVDAHEYGDFFTKRIFRIVPADYHRGL